jgi:hypothetical protein
MHLPASVSVPDRTFNLSQDTSDLFPGSEQEVGDALIFRVTPKIEGVRIDML